MNLDYSQKQVSEILFLDEDTVQIWKEKFVSRVNSIDLESWLSDRYLGYVGKINYMQISHLRTYLRTFNVGSKSRIISFVCSAMGIKYSVSGMQKLLHRTGFSHKCIHRLPGQADVGKQELFIEKLADLTKNLTENTSIMFMDSTHPQHNTVCSKVWIEKGSERWIESNTGRERVNINGIYNPSTQEVIIETAPTINAGVSIKLLKKVAQKNPQLEKIYIIADNARYNKCEQIKTYLDSQAKIQMVYLPPYSPNLNLIERLWKIMKEKVIHLKFYKTVAEFKNAINDFFDNIQIYKQELASRITFKFQTFQNAVFADA